MTLAGVVGALLERFHARRPIRAGSLVVTVYGDAIVPRGGSLWFGSLALIMRACRVEEGVVRTAMSRLAADSWVEGRRIGRRAYYRLTHAGGATFAQATRRIYFERPHPWTGAWQIVVLGGDGGRAERRTALEADGWGLLAPNVAVAPAGCGASGGGLDDFVFRAEEPDLAAARRVAATAWPLARLAERYRGFLAAFAPAAALDPCEAAADPLAALVLRIMLIHEYRRIVLHDPQLPTALLAPSWPGAEARSVSARIYRAVVPPSEAWLDRHALAESGPLPPPDPAFRRRFGGE